MSESNEDLKKVTQRRRPHGPGARMMPGEKAKDFKGSIGKLVRFMGQFKAALVLAIIFAIGSAAFNIVGPKVLSQATTELFEGLVAKVGGTGGIDFDAIAGIIATTLVLYLVSAACSFVQGWMMTSVSQRTCYGLRRAIAEKIDRMAGSADNSVAVRIASPCIPDQNGVIIVCIFRLYEGQLADVSGINALLCLDESGCIAAYLPDHENAVALSDSIDNGIDILSDKRQRLFAKNMLFRGKRVGYNLPVKLIGNSNDHRVNLRVGKNLMIIGGRFRNIIL